MRKERWRPFDALGAHLTSYSSGPPALKSDIKALMYYCSRWCDERNVAIKKFK